MTMYTPSAVFGDLS